uniref:Protein AATF n=1 Tax=Magallana gigas TaxID=29159 RepID=K1QS13_MAGGI
MSLREEIAKLTTPTPVFCDPEDDIDDATAAKLTEKSADNEEFAPLPASKLRQRVAAQSASTEKKYAGRKISRSKLVDLDSDNSESEQSSGSMSGDEDEDSSLNDEEMMVEEEQGDEDDEDESVGSEDIKTTEEVEEELSALGLFKAKMKSSTDTQQPGQKFSESEQSSGSMSGEEDEDSSLNDEEMMVEEEQGDEDDEDESVGSEDIKTTEEVEEELSALGLFKAKMKSSTDTQQPGQKFSFVDDGDYSKYYDSGEDGEEHSDEDDEESDEEEEEEDEDKEGSEEEEDEDIEDEEEDEGGMSSFSKSQLNEEIQKGEAARQQLGLWDSLLEGRIKFQKILSAVNQLPQPDTWREFEESGEDNFKEKKASDDEEITSESDSEEPHEATGNVKETKTAFKRKLATEEIPEFLAKRHKDLHSYRNDTLQKWYDKTRLLGGKLSSKSFSGFEQSAVKQIEQQETERKPAVHTYDPEIFDDSDFYHQQLRELIERKTSDINDPIALSRQWLEIQRLRNKVKRKQETERKPAVHTYDPEIFDDSDFYHQQLRELIERKTSDINDPIALSRYHVHPKLVNFMAPKETCNWSDEARDDLFKSLFGQRGPTAPISSDESMVGR